MYIVIEGGEGSGKSSLINWLHEKLQETRGDMVYRTREPGGTIWSEKLRDFLFSPLSDELMGKEEEVLLFAASRINLIREIKKWRTEGRIVISDRNVWSSLAYQAADLPQHAELIKRINQELCGDDIVPDLVIYLSVNPDTGLDRAGSAARKGDQNRNDFRPVNYHEQVSNRYGALVANRVLAKEVCVISSHIPQTEVFAEALALVESRL